MSDVNLELQRITKDSPVSMLKRVIEGEAVHAVRSWSDLENRLASDRRCYAFVDPSEPLEPLLFTEVALSLELPRDIHVILDEGAPTLDETEAQAAVFYSLSNTRPELRGRSLGFGLLCRAVEELRRELPHLRTFATLSPIPSFSKWLASWFDTEGNEPFSASAGVPLAAESPSKSIKDTLREILADPAWVRDAALVQYLSAPMTFLAQYFLLDVKRDGRPADPVARFHLGNGAQVESVNWMADTSPKGISQSCSLMVNYHYDLSVLGGHETLALSA